MDVILRAILVLTLVLQPMVLSAQVFASCRRGAAAVPITPAAAPASDKSCCGMSSGECCCGPTSAAGCACAAAPTEVPASPERATNPVPDLTAMVAVPVAVLVWTNPTDDPALATLAFATNPLRNSVDSIQSLLCVWTT